VFGEDPIYAESFGGAGKVIERRIAFAEGDDVIEIFDDGEEIAETPYTGLIDRQGGGTALLPEPTEGAGVGELRVGGDGVAVGNGRPGIDHVVEAVASGAAKYAIYGGAGNPCAALCASELMCRDFHGFC
jgi:hypothetical protein